MKKITPIIFCTLPLFGIDNGVFTSTTGKNTTPHNNWSWTEMRDYCFGFMSSFWNNATTQNNNFNNPSTRENINTAPNNNSRMNCMGL